MYKTLDGELTCEACTLNQCDGEIPDGAVWVDGGTCYLCGIRPPVAAEIDVAVAESIRHNGFGHPMIAAAETRAALAILAEYGMDDYAMIDGTIDAWGTTDDGDAWRVTSRRA